MKYILLLIAAVLILTGGIQFGNALVRGDAFGGYAFFLCLTQVLAGFVTVYFVLINSRIDSKVLSKAKSFVDSGSSKDTVRKEIPVRLLGILCCFVAFLLFGGWIAHTEGGSPLVFVDKIMMFEVFNWGTVEVVSSKFQTPLTILIGTSVALMLASLSVGIILTAIYVFLSSDRLRRYRDILSNGVHFFGSIPFVIPLLIFRILYYTPVQAESVLRRVQNVPGMYNYIAMEGISVGLMSAALFLGCTIGSSMWKWLDTIESGIQQSAAGQLSLLNNRNLRSQIFREGLWIGFQQELLQRLLVGVAAVTLIDIVSGAVLDTFYFVNLGSGSSSFPLYPSLGTVLFLGEAKGIGQPINPWIISLIMILLMLQLLFASLPTILRPPKIRTYGSAESPFLVVQSEQKRKKIQILGFGDLVLPNGKTLTKNVSIGPGWTQYKGINYVLGESGTGKSTYLRALQSRFLGESVPLYQDPDTCLPKDMSVSEVFELVCKNNPIKAANILHVFDLTIDERVRTACFDPYTPVFRLSRGERQRFAFALAWGRILDDLGLEFDTNDKKEPIFKRASGKESNFFVYMDEFTSAQDAFRSDKMWTIVQKTIDSLCNPEIQHFFIATHDPESLKSSKWDRKLSSYHETSWENRTLWFGHGDDKAEMFIKYLCEGEDSTTEYEKTFQTFRQALQSLEYYDIYKGEKEIEKTLESGEQKIGSSKRIQLKKFPTVSISGKKENALQMGPNFLTTKEDFGIIKGTVNILKGPSGTGKSTLLAHLRNSSTRSKKYVVGWIPQDPSRAFPPEMTTMEALALLDTNKKEFDRAKKLFGSQANELDFWIKPVRSLSEGQRQRVAIVRELLRLEREASKNKFIILMLDEPFGSLDPANHIRIMRELIEWMRERNKRGSCSLIIISHTPKLEKEISRGLDILKPPVYDQNNSLYTKLFSSLKKGGTVGYPVRYWEIQVEGVDNKEPDDHGSSTTQTKDKHWEKIGLNFGSQEK